MPRVTLQNLGSILRDQRGARGIREVAREIGTSPATLSRVEGGNLPDLTTFGKLCKWLDADPGEILGVHSAKSLSPGRGPTEMAAAHLRAKREIKPQTAAALAKVIVAAQRLLGDDS